MARPFSSRILFENPEQKLVLEARNGLLQFDETMKLVAEFNGKLQLTPETLTRLQECAIRDLYVCAGYFRDGDVRISGSKHQPPPHKEVIGLVQEMCDYVNNAKSNGKSPIHVAAYLMWRLNWIHPFFGGNGRTSRAVSYLALCTSLGFVLPGKNTIPEQIMADRHPYYSALSLADDAWQANVIDVSAMEVLLDKLLAVQLVAIHNLATGKSLTP